MKNLTSSGASFQTMNLRERKTRQLLKFKNSLEVTKLLKKQLFKRKRTQEIHGALNEHILMYIA